MKVVGGGNARFLVKNSGIRITELDVPPISVLFDPKDIDALRPKHIYVVLRGELGNSGQISALCYRLGPAKRVAHKTIAERHGDYEWVKPNKEHGEICRWEYSGDFVSIMKLRVS